MTLLMNVLVLVHEILVFALEGIPTLFVVVVQLVIVYVTTVVPKSLIETRLMCVLP